MLKLNLFRKVCDEWIFDGSYDYDAKHINNLLCTVTFYARTGNYNVGDFKVVVSNE